MTHSGDVAFSRPLAAARTLGKAGRDDGSFIDKSVLLTGEEVVLRTANGRWMAVDSLRLMVRTWRKVAVYLPPGAAELTASLRAIADRIQFAEPLVFLEQAPRFSNYDAILSIGTQTGPSLPWTVINSNGWLARVSSSDRTLPGNCDQANPLGALAAASLGIADVFKRTALKPEHMDLFDGLRFSSFDLGSAGDDPGPELPSVLQMPPTLFLGHGAIGNANILLAGQLPFMGNALLLDKDCYGIENLGTCVLLGPAEAANKVEKVRWNQDYLRSVGSQLETQSLRMDVEAAKPSVQPYLSLVINGLDGVEPRHAAQDLWPDAIVDGALRRFQAQFVAYDHGSGYACLRCLFDLPRGRDPLVVQAELTGLSVEALAADEEIGEAHIKAAPEDKRVFLESRRGQKAVAVGCARAIEAGRMLADGANVGFAPSVPFVATMTGVLVMGEVVRRLMGRSIDVRRFQFDLLVGPQRGSVVNEGAKSACRCQSRKGPIERHRDLRRSQAGL